MIYFLSDRGISFSANNVTRWKTSKEALTWCNGAICRWYKQRHAAAAEDIDDDAAEGDDEDEEELLSKEGLHCYFHAYVYIQLNFCYLVHRVSSSICQSREYRSSP
jgi:hypothetical protein